MKRSDYEPLSYFNDEQRAAAVDIYKIIKPNIIGEVSLSRISNETTIPLRTLQRWKNGYQKYGLSGLIRSPRSDSGSTKVDTTVQSLIENTRLNYRRISIATIHRKVSAQCNQQSLPVSSYKQVYRIVKSMPNSIIELAHHGVKSYSEKYDLIYIREAEKPNEFWQADHTLLDIEVLDGKMQRRRPWLSVIMDDYSRAIAGYFISFDAPSAIHTALMLHQAIWRKENSEWPICGIPEIFYTDHGSDFTSRHLEQVAMDLKIRLVFSKKGVPRGRGKIERFFLSINQLLLESLPGYTKNRTTEKLLTIQELEKKIEYFLIYDYNHRIHSSTQKTPVNNWNRSGFLPQMPESLEDLDLLLLHVSKSRKVHSDGIRFQGFCYINTNLSAYVGEFVQIRYNPQDLAEVRVFFQNKYPSTAISPELSDVTVDIKDIVAARSKRKQQLKNQVSEIKSVADTLLEEKAKEPAKKNRKDKKSKLKRYFND